MELSLESSLIHYQQTHCSNNCQAILHSEYSFETHSAKQKEQKLETNFFVKNAYIHEIQ